MRQDHIERSLAEASDREPPQGLESFADWFFQLHAGRGSTGFGPVALQYTEIEAWARLSRVRLNAWSLRLLKMLDGIYMRLAVERMKSEAEKR